MELMEGDPDVVIENLFVVAFVTYVLLVNGPETWGFYFSPRESGLLAHCGQIVSKLS